MSLLARVTLLIFVMVFLPLQIYACTPEASPAGFPVCVASSSECASLISTKVGSLRTQADSWCSSNSATACTGITNSANCKASIIAACGVDGGVASSADPAGCSKNDSDGKTYCNYVPHCNDGEQTYAWAKNFLQNFLEPFYEMIIIVARLIGIFLVFWGLMRVRRHGQHNMMYRLSPMATVMYFVVGAIFAAFMPFALTFSGGLFGTGTATTGAYAQNAAGYNSNLLYRCSEGGGNTSASNLSGAVYCPILGYANAVSQDSDLQSDPQQTMMQVVYAVLLVIGIISFLRGFLFLLKMGEGQGGDGSMQKAVVHIIAGVIGMNAQSFQDLLSTGLPSNTPT